MNEKFEVSGGNPHSPRSRISDLARISDLEVENSALRAALAAAEKQLAEIKSGMRGE